jgi:hypothetical protein
MPSLKSNYLTQEIMLVNHARIRRFIGYKLPVD